MPASESPTHPPAADAQTGDRLESWKEIAVYLGRSTRTLRRWEQSQGLPVHRLNHEKRASVYAFKSELDSWRQSRSGLLNEESEESDESVEKPKPRAKRVWIGRLIGVAVVSLVGWWLSSVWFGPVPASSPVQLTFETGGISFAAISRDSKLLAYAGDSSGSGHMDIYVKPLSGAEPVRVTSHPASDKHPDFSPDGTRIVFSSTRDVGGIYVVTLLPLLEKRIASGGVYPRFSPDGKWVAFTSAEFDRTFVIPAEGGSTRPIQSKFKLVRHPIWVSNARLIYFGSRNGEDAGLDWWSVPLDGGDSTPTGTADALRKEGLTVGRQGVYHADWIAGRLIVSILSGGSANLWQIPISSNTWRVTGQPRRLTLGPGMHTYPRAWPGASGRDRVVFTNEHITTHIWTLPIDTNQPQQVTGEPVQITHDSTLKTALQGTRPALSIDGEKLAYASAKSGNFDIWLKDIASGRERALTSSSWDEDRPVISPDGTRVAYRSFENQRPAVFSQVISSEGPEKATILCRDCDNPLDWSADKRFFLFARGDPQRLWMLDTNSGIQTDLVKQREYRLWSASFSPDSRWIVLTADNIGDGKMKGFVAPFSGGPLPDPGQWIAVSDTAPAPLQWSPGGNTLYLLAEWDNFRCLWALRLDPATKRRVGPPVAVHHFHHQQRAPWQEFPLTIARRHIAIGLTESDSNIWSSELK